jgi:uncharacterized SAM-binding protein YcdF (DUF218 family)
MDSSTIISKLFEIIILPPGHNLLLFGLGYWLLTKSKKLAKVMFLLSIGSLFIFSLPIVSSNLQQGLYQASALPASEIKRIADQQPDDMAIVVLSGGRLERSPEYGDIDTVSSTTLQRIHFAAWLHRKTNLPILVSGGSVYGEATAESVLVNQAMTSAFSIAPKWIEFKSKNTLENAQYSTEILHKNNIKQILLVTHASHMKRAKLAFEEQQIKVIAAPTVFDSHRTKWSSYLPNAKALFETQKALHEYLGHLWYQL